MAADTKRLKYFVQVAESGSLSKAAEMLHIAQPALSRQIHMFEEYLGFPLFVRTGRGMQLTREGEYLRNAVVGPLRDLELAIENMRSFMSRAENFTIGIGIHTDLSPVIATPLIGQMEQALPDVRFRILEGPSITLSEWLKRGTIDFALLDQPAADDSLSTRLLCSEDLMVVVARQEKGCGDSPLTINQLKEISFILPSTHHGTRKIVDEAVKQAKLSLNIVFETDSLVLMSALAREGRGALLLPRSVARQVCSEKNMSMQSIELPILKSGIYLASRSYGEIEGSLITKIDRTIKATVVDLMAA